MKEPLISLINLHKKYYDKTIFSKVNLDIYKGEIVCIMGNSGMGKTTLLGIISQLDNDFSGKVTYSNDVFENIEVPFPTVFQNSDDIVPWLTVKENMNLVSKNMDKSLIQEILKNVKMDEDINKYPFELSGGMKQRLSIGRALLFNSKIILMDEPFNSLDKNLKMILYKLLKDIHKKTETTFLIVTHDEYEAMYLGDRILRLEEDGLYEVNSLS
jgi:ABC-type nitrate/sulfonate/bicarbonate transport system ATPase subunit